MKPSQFAVCPRLLDDDGEGDNGGGGGSAVLKYQEHEELVLR